jgi:type IV fimbrial biogenesis protein FimT
MIITVGVVAIIMSTAVPSLNSSLKNNRLASHLNNVVADLHFARSEAVKRDVRVILCRSSNPNATNPTCSGSDYIWTSGYIIFADDGNYTNNTYDAGTDILLRRGQPAGSGVTLRTNPIWNHFLEYNPGGSLNEGGTALMSICDDRGRDYGKQIVVAPNGIPKLYSSDIPSCYPS